jgi:tetratricopeptide (TPR) repeat protein
MFIAGMAVSSIAGLATADDVKSPIEHIRRQDRSEEADPGWRAFDSGDLESAELEWTRQMEDARDKGQEARYGSLLCNQSYVQEKRGHYQEAIDLVERCLLMLNMDYKNLAAIQRPRLAGLYGDARFEVAAEQQLLRLIDEASMDEDGDRVKSAALLGKLGRRYQDRGLESEAERAYLRGIDAVRSIDPPHLFLLSNARSLIRLYESQGRVDRAADVCGWYLPLIDKRYPPDDPEIRNCRHLLERE